MSRFLERALLAAALSVVALACTKPNPTAGCPDGQCEDPRYPFCDVHGVIGGEPGRCLAVQCTAGEFSACDGESALHCNSDGTSYVAVECGAGCDAATGCRPFCSPGAALSCSADNLITCNEQGTATFTETCALGCASDAIRCLTFQPSNGLEGLLAASASEPDVTLPPGTRIDTDSGAIQDASGNPLSLPSKLINQIGAAPIRAFSARSLSMSDVTVLGSNPLAFVARGAITISGKLEARARATTGGPGAQSSSSCNGADTTQYSCICSPAFCSKGAGGAGNSQNGGRGGAATPANGGAPLASFTPLAGGCSGGSQRDPNASVVARGGGGGGAVQLVSLDRVTIADNGVIHVGGGGGASTAGGGSGGMVIIESPRVVISGATAGVAANGGAGGGCGSVGLDGTASTAPAAGAVCADYFAGSGGTGSTAPGNGCVIGVDTCTSSCPVVYGGGGGAAGRMRVVTKAGGFESSGTPILSVQIVTGTLAPK